MNTHVFIYGPPASGKSNLARQLAQDWGVPFYDLDDQITAASGQTIPEIFSTGGESGFRRLESQILIELLNLPAGVVALGGGALLAAKNRTAVEAAGSIICLSAQIETLLGNLSKDQNQRPLLPGNYPAELAKLLNTRRSHYSSFPNQLVVDGKSIQDLSVESQILLGVFRVTGMGGDYFVRVQPGLLAELPKHVNFKLNFPSFALITDNHVNTLLGNRLVELIENQSTHISRLVLPPGEQTKSIQILEQSWEFLLQSKIERGSMILALGGGVIGDLAGFAAATYLRGISWVNLPTSLLAMVDASIGGKTGINMPQGKNLVGSFHAPALVLTDPAALATLPLAEIKNGLAEVVKHAVIADPGLFAICEAGLQHLSRNWTALLRRAIAVKIRVVNADPYEKDLRQVLNFGHTIGHAVESASSFSISHGQAVSIGMVAEARIAERVGLAEAGLSQRIGDCLANLGLPTQIPGELSKQRMIDTMLLDKKRAGGKIKFALPERIGRVQHGVEINQNEELF